MNLNREYKVLSIAPYRDGVLAKVEIKEGGGTETPRAISVHLDFYDIAGLAQQKAEMIISAGRVPEVRHAAA